MVPGGQSQKRERLRAAREQRTRVGPASLEMRGPSVCDAQQVASCFVCPTTISFAVTRIQSEAFSADTRSAWVAIVRRPDQCLPFLDPLCSSPFAERGVLRTQELYFFIRFFFVL